MAIPRKDLEITNVVSDQPEYVGESVEERVDAASERGKARLTAEQLLEIGRKCAALPDYDTRTAEEILGYDENGVPT
jgi:antitoxin VapB